MATHLLLVLFAALITCIYVSRVASERFDQLYLEGVQAYRDEQWSQSADLMRRSIDQYSVEIGELLSCVKQCREERSTVKSEYVAEGSEASLQHQLLHVSHCARKCRERTASFGGISGDLVHTFETRLPFDFLSFSLHKMAKNKDACKAFVTFQYFNPEHDKVEGNMKFYNNLNLETSAYVPEQTLPFKDLYIEGTDFYGEQKWEESASKLEQSLKEFYKELDRCYVMCEAVSDVMSSEYQALLSGLFISSLKCRTKCIDKLDNFRLDMDDDIFTRYFQYLQFAYYKLERMEDALNAFAALRKIRPESEIVLDSLDFYRKQAPEADWKIREDDEQVIQQVQDDRALLELFTEVSGNILGDSEPKENDSMLLEQDYQDHPVGQKVEVIVSMKDEELNGPNRVLFDNVISDDDCQVLIELAGHGIEGDGYPSRSPHTINEKFEGLTPTKAAKGVLSGNISREVVQLYLDSAEKSRALVEEHFELNSTLYFSFTHLVCRTAMPESQEFRSDLSHPVHADNCILDSSTGECNKVQPAYTWRDYSAILYLNGDFEGGKFFFAHSVTDLTPQTLVTPKCGRLVGFSAGKENMHGVTAVTSGRRCAVALWFTLDQTYKEAESEEAQKTLSNL